MEKFKLGIALAALSEKCMQNRVQSCRIMVYTRSTL